MTNINVIYKTQRIIVSLPSPINVGHVKPRVVVTLAGPPGPSGSNGEAISYLHTQVELSSSWVINHNLGFMPNVTVSEVDSGTIIEPGEIHHSLNQLELQFNTPRAGIARLS